MVEYSVAGAGVDGVNRAGGDEAVHLKQASSFGFGVEAQTQAVGAAQIAQPAIVGVGVIEGQSAADIARGYRLPGLVVLVSEYGAAILWRLVQ